MYCVVMSWIRLEASLLHGVGCRREFVSCSSDDEGCWDGAIEEESDGRHKHLEPISWSSVGLEIEKVQPSSRCSVIQRSRIDGAVQRRHGIEGSCHGLSVKTRQWSGRRCKRRWRYSIVSTWTNVQHSVASGSKGRSRIVGFLNQVHEDLLFGTVLQVAPRPYVCLKELCVLISTLTDRHPLRLVVPKTRTATAQRLCFAVAASSINQSIN